MTDGPGTVERTDGRRRFTVADVRASYPERKSRAELWGELPLWLVYRPLSFRVTPLFLNLGIPASAVTLASAALAAGMVGVAALGVERAHLWVAGLGLLWHVLDCVDGNIARVLGRATRLGALLDALVDSLCWVALFLSLGLLVARTGGGLWGAAALPVALGLPVALLVNRRLRDEERLSAGRAGDEEPPPFPRTVGGWLYAGLAGLENLYAAAIGVGGELGRLDLVLVGIAVYVGLVSGWVVVTVLARAARADLAARGSGEATRS